MKRKLLLLKALFYKKAFVFLCAALVLGILLGAQLIVYVDSLLTLLIFFVIIACAELFLELKSYAYLISIHLFFLLLGSFLFQNASPENRLKWFENYDHQNFRANLTIEEIGNTEKEWVKCRASVSKIYVGDQAKSAAMDLVVYVESSPEFLRKGDEIVVVGEIKRIENSGNPGAFDAETYWRNKGVLYAMFLPSENYTVIDHHTPFILVRWTDAIFSYCSSFFKHNFGSQEGAVLSAIVLGDKSALDTETVNSFLNTGTMHVLAVSGMHFGLLMLMLMAVFTRFSRFISKKQALIFLLIFFWFYAILTGLSASVVRSIFMFSMLVAAQLFNRRYDSMNVLFFSAFVLLLIDPLTLFDIGFQLSYLAMVGIFLFYGPIRDFVPIKNGYLLKVWEGTAVGLAAQIMTIPISLYYFHQFPNYFLLSNWVLMLTSNFILGMGAGILLISKFPLLYKPLAFLLGNIVVFSLFCLSQIEHLPGAVAYGFDLYFFQVIIFVVASFMLFFARSWKFRFTLGIPLFVLSVGFVAYQRYHRLSKNEICVLNFPQSVLVVKQGNENLCFFDAKKLKKRARLDALLVDYQKVNPGKIQIFPIDNRQFNLNFSGKKVTVFREKNGIAVVIEQKKYIVVDRFKSLENPDGITLGRAGSLNCDYYLENGAKILASN
ncbi:MAG: ComEC/Rec2 family competence protein [Bacteroidota bacterium]